MESLLVLQEQVQVASYTSTIKMYAVVDNKIVINAFVGDEQELKKQQIKHSNYKFVEMTLENSPISIGDKI